MENENEIVQYFIVNSEIKISAPKLSAQIGHVATIITHEIINNYYTIDKHEVMEKYIEWKQWYNNGKNQKKIILRGKEKQLLKLIEQGFYYIRDNGNNELPSGTLTAVGLPPMKRNEAQKYIKKLQLYKGENNYVS